MRAADLLFWLWRALLAGRSRSLLSALGIAIGIASVTLLTGIGEGLRLYLLDSFSQFGTRLIAVTPGKTETAGGPPGILSSSRPLLLEDAGALARLPGVEAAPSGGPGAGGGGQRRVAPHRRHPGHRPGGAFRLADHPGAGAFFARG